MGDVLTLEPGEEIEVNVRIPPTIEPYVLGVDLVQSDEVETRMTAIGDGVFTLALDATADWMYARLSIDGNTWYKEAPCDDGGDDEERIWLSPTYIDWLEVDPKDTGDTAENTDTNPTDDSRLTDSDCTAAPPDDSGVDEDPGADLPCGCNGNPKTRWSVASALLALFLYRQRRSTRHAVPAQPIV